MVLRNKRLKKIIEDELSESCEEEENQSVDDELDYDEIVQEKINSSKTKYSSKDLKDEKKCYEKIDLNISRKKS